MPATLDGPDHLLLGWDPRATARSATVDPNFPRATRSIGDYSGIAAVGGDVVVSWTDLRDQACLGGLCAAGQGQFVARMP